MKLLYSGTFTHKSPNFSRVRSHMLRNIPRLFFRYGIIVSRSECVRSWSLFRVSWLCEIFIQLFCNTRISSKLGYAKSSNFWRDSKVRTQISMYYRGCMKFLYSRTFTQKSPNFCHVWSRMFRNTPLWFCRYGIIVSRSECVHLCSLLRVSWLSEI